VRALSEALRKSAGRSAGYHPIVGIVPSEPLPIPEDTHDSRAKPARAVFLRKHRDNKERLADGVAHPRHHDCQCERRMCNYLPAQYGGGETLRCKVFHDLMMV
jgi:hypothetical protein